MMATYLNMVDLIIIILSRKDLDYTKTNIFTHLLADTVMIKLSEYTTEKLVKYRYAPTNVHEFKNSLVHGGYEVDFV